MAEGAGIYSAWQPGVDLTLLSLAARGRPVLGSLRSQLSRGVGVDHVADTTGGDSEYNICLTPLQHVCKSGITSDGKNLEDRVACVKLLIEHGACVDAGAPGNPGQSTDTHTLYTPLMYAALSQHLDLVKILLSAGSDVSVLCTSRNGFPASALTIAVLSYGAISHNNPKDCDAVIETLLRAGADANPPEWRGTTVMEMAIRHGRRRIWPLLLRAGAILPANSEDPDEHTYHYDIYRAHPYLQKIDMAGGWKAYEKAHRTELLATFTPKFTHLVPEELVPLIVEFSFHVGFY